MQNPIDHIDFANPSSIRTMIQKGVDPKPKLIEFCKPSCKFWQDKLQRCEGALKTMKSADPEKNCMYPLRDWVTCLEACVQPKIHSQLIGQI
mmetsp:Transcript_42404/g.49114  ORF Transcript_42404/g.49114 Transcript_42404/m.49114 type:complete len:92 (+) Transcript_42404:32-307(+)